MKISKENDGVFVDQLGWAIEWGVAMNYAKQEAIEFRQWMDSRGYFAQMKEGTIGSLGYIRQENQVVFSKWQPLEQIYELYLLHKQNKEQ